MDFIRERANVSYTYGNMENMFAQAKHYIGRLASHVKAVKVLVAAAVRLPNLFVDFLIVRVESPSSVKLPPGIRNQTRLDGIANRMVPAGEPNLLTEVQSRLEDLNARTDLEDRVRTEYENKNFVPRVHAELILLEHFWKNRETLHYLDNDPYIGTSKPACYCCSLYIREHPAGFEPPSSHQKIYLNWIPPTSDPGMQPPGADMAVHEENMLNKMVRIIRQRTIEQIRTQSGPRRKHFDSVTGETFSTRALAALSRERQVSQFPTHSGKCFACVIAIR